MNKIAGLHYALKGIDVNDSQYESFAFLNLLHIKKIRNELVAS